MRVETPGWMSDAACRGLDAGLFFPNRGESTAPAVAVCRRCPVQAECLAYVVTSRSPRILHGVWGGTTERERRFRRGCVS